MVQSGDEYREKNRIRLQRFYEKQKQQGKKRVSALVSDEAYRLLTDQKDQAGESISVLVDQAVMIAYGEQGIPDIMSDEAYALLMDAKEHTGDSMSTLVDRAVKAAFGYEDLLDIDDPALNEEIIPNFEGPGRDDTGMEPGAIEDAVNAMGGPVESIKQEQADAQGDDVEDIELDITLVNPDPETDDAALGDQEPDTAVESEKVTEILPEADTADDQDPDIIPDCTGRSIDRQERDRILVQLAERMQGSTPEIVQARVDLLNEKSVPVSLKSGQHGGEWTRKKFTDNLRHSKKRLGIE